MARPSKIGLDYFPLDVDFMENDKLLVVKGKYGIEGVYIVVRLLCDIYKNCYYIKWDETSKFAMLDKVRPITEQKLEAVVGELIHNEFFDSFMYVKYEILTSRNIQATFFTAIKRRVKDKDWPYLIEDEEAYYETTGDEKREEREENDYSYCMQKQELMYTETHENVTEMPQSKVKESKEREMRKKSLKERFDEMWPGLSHETRVQINRLNDALLSLGVENSSQRLQIIFGSKLGEVGGRVWELIANLRSNSKVKEKGVYILRCMKNDKDNFINL